MSTATFSRIVEIDETTDNIYHYARARCEGEWAEWSSYWADMGL